MNVCRRQSLFDLRDPICASASPRNNSTSGFLHLDYSAIVMMSDYIRGTAEGAPSACVTKVIVFIADVVEACVEDETR